MSFSNEYLLRVDIKRRLSSVVPTFKQGDNGVLKFEIYDNGRKYDLSGYTYSEITFRMPSGKSIVGNPVLGSDGILTYNFTGVEMAEVGRVETIVSIYSGNTMVSIQPFFCFIYDSMKGEDLSYIGILQDLIEEVQLLRAEVTEVVIEANEALTEAKVVKEEVENLNTNITAQEEIRDSNETQRITNENTRISNEDSRKVDEQTREQNEQIRETNEVIRQQSLTDMNTIIAQFKTTGTYNSNTTYKKFNQVEFEGSTYIALIDNTNVPVSNTSTWRLLAKKGEKGDKGDTGAALSILGLLTEESQLPPTGNSGDAYTINGELYVWSENTGKWENVGNIKGEKGDKGDTGKDGESAYQIAVDNGFVGTSEEWLASLKGEKGEDADLTVVNQEISTIKQSITEHLSEKVSSEVGAHGIRYFDDELAVKNDLGDWDVVETGSDGIGGIPVDISDIKDGEGIAYDASSNKFIPSRDISKPIIYGIKIDTLNSNPETAVTYTDSAIGFTPAKGNNGSFSYGSWGDKFPFNQIKPCLLKDGVVNYYLNPNDYSKKLNGGNADITSGNDGDVMVEFPKIYWKFETIGNDLYIKYSDKQADSTYKCLAHTRGVNEKDKIYLSAYTGFSLSSKLRSLSGKTPTVNQNISQFRTLAKANGVGYEQSTYYQILMLQVLFIAMFKNRDSQTALGRGYVDGNSSSITTGGANAKGMFYGESTGKLQNKFCGIEDFWGNVYYWIDGFFCDASRNILIGNNNYNDTGNGYVNYGQGTASNLSGYINAVQGGTETGFIIKSNDGSATTYYADFGHLNATSLPRFGGSWVDASAAGAFRLQVAYSSSTPTANLSARLSLC